MTVLSPQIQNLSEQFSSFGSRLQRIEREIKKKKTEKKHKGTHTPREWEKYPEEVHNFWCVGRLPPTLYQSINDAFLNYTLITHNKYVQTN